MKRDISEMERSKRVRNDEDGVVERGYEWTGNGKQLPLVAVCGNK